VPDESTVRKLARRLGSEVVQEITRVVIEKAKRETRFRGRAARIGSTVVEADIRYPSDAMLALQGARALAREGRKVAGMINARARVTDRSRSIGRAVRAISRTLTRRTREAKAQVMVLNGQAGRLIASSVREAQRLAARARASARGRGAQAKLRAAAKLQKLATRCYRVAEQIDRRARGLKITDRLVSIADPDARPIRKGKLGKPTEFGYVAQICEVTENTRRGARGFILPAGHAPGNPAENRLLPHTAAELDRAGIRPREIVGDGGFMPGPTTEAFPDLADEQIQLSGRHDLAPVEHASAERATAPAPRAASATSIAATDYADPGSKAMTGCRPRPAGRSWPTTSTPSPSEPTENAHSTGQHP